MNKTYRDLLKHSGVYGLGQILSRAISFLLLPVYTHYLTPADYGCIALLDISVGVLGIVIGAGIGQAVNRFHFAVSDEESRSEVWWTGLTQLTLTATTVVVPAMLWRGDLAWWALGEGDPAWPSYFALALPTLWLNTIGGLLENYCRVLKWSGTFVVLSLTRLVFNGAFNVLFLAGFGLGVAGVLLGNLITACLFAGVLFLLFCSHRGPPRVRAAVARSLWAFGSPILVTSLLATLMNQSNRYFLGAYADLAEVGLYSLAFAVGQAVNTLVLMPFSSIWNVVRFEVADRPDGGRVFRQVFQSFTNGLILLLLGISLFARPVVALIASPAYAPAAELIPAVCLAAYFFSLTHFVTLPAMLKQQSYRLLPGSLVGVGGNLLLNWLLIPRWGAAGAAWASVLTFAAFSWVNYVCCRCDRTVCFPVGNSLLVLGGAVATFVAVTSARLLPLPEAVHYGLAAVVWSAIACALFAGVAARIWREVLPAETLFRPRPESGRAASPQEERSARPYEVQLLDKVSPFPSAEPG